MESPLCRITYAYFFHYFICRPGHGRVNDKRIHRSPTENNSARCLTIKCGGLGFRVRLWGVVRDWVRVGVRVTVSK